jgi:hypothetical protein
MAVSFAGEEVLFAGQSEGGAETQPTYMRPHGDPDVDSITKDMSRVGIAETSTDKTPKRAVRGV